MSASLQQEGSSVMIIDGGITAFSSSGSGSKDDNYNQLDKIVVQVNDSKYLDATTKALTSMLKRRHQQVDDFQISVPELLLKQEQKTKDIFNIVLGCHCRDFAGSRRYRHHEHHAGFSHGTDQRDRHPAGIRGYEEGYHIPVSFGSHHYQHLRRGDRHCPRCHFLPS